MSNRMSNKLLKKELPCFDKLSMNGKFFCQRISSEDRLLIKERKNTDTP